MYSAEKPEDIDRFFRGLTEHAFHARLGIVDPPLVDYVATLLIRSIRSDQLPGWPAAAVESTAELVSGDELDEEALLTLVASRPPAGEEFRLLGDSALFWTGVYPEALLGPHALPGIPMPAGGAMVTYRMVGKRAYRIASVLADSATPVDRGVLERLAEEFDLCAEGLSEVRRAWSEAA